MRSAFTLVELAIVIVIIGLLVGGVLQGQELIKQAQVRSQIKQVQDYTSATFAFMAKYNGIPGDINNGDVLFGTECATPITDCKGNANGIIDSNNEAWKFWRQLSLGKFIRGSFTGIAASDGTVFNCAENCPTAAYKGGVITNGIGNPIHYGQNTGGNILELGMRRPSDGMARLALLRPADALMLEQKIDDGNPGAGKVFTLRGTDYNTDASKCVDKEYFELPPISFLLSDESESCRMQFKMFN